MSKLFRASCAALCASLVAVLLLVDAPPARAAGEQDWRLLYADGELRDGTGALKSNIPVGISIDFPYARFSRDGTRLATWSSESVRLHRPDGTSFELARVPNFRAISFAWSPNDSSVAALGVWATSPQDRDIRIYRFPVDGSPATLVYSDTQLLQIFEYGGLSWNPDSNELAFIATEFVPGETGGYVASLADTDQVWTVPAQTGATPTRFTGRPVCADLECSNARFYREPIWSPDGTRLAVAMQAGLDFEATVSVGYLQQGALAADELIDAAPQDQLAWSSDGDRLAFGVYDTSGDFYDETLVVDADTGTVLRTVEDVIAPFVDLLPCPGGSCPVWQDVYVPPKPALNLRGRAKGPRVIVTGEMFRVPIEADVQVTLHKRAKAGAKWRKVTTAKVRVVEGLFRKTFPRPRAVQCKAVGVYTDGDQRATDSVTFSC